MTIKYAVNRKRLYL